MGSQSALLKENLEAPSGFEPLNDGFADRSLNHLGTAPMEAEYTRFGVKIEARIGPTKKQKGQSQCDCPLLAIA